MKLLFIGDVHAADRPPAGRTDDYRESVRNKLLQISGICKSREIDYALCAGDIFHNKYPNRVSHSLVQELIEVFKSFPCPVLTVPGNHDMGPDELGSLDRQPLGVLGKSLAIEVLTSERSLSRRVHVFPRPWNTAEDANPTYYSLTAHELNTPGVHIGLAHGSVVNPGNSRPYPYVDAADIPGIGAYDLFVAGHIHENLGISKVHVLDGSPTLFANPGSIMRVSRNLASFSRKVQVLLVTIEEGAIWDTELIDLDVAPAEEVFADREPGPEGHQMKDEVLGFVKALGEGLEADQFSPQELVYKLDLGDDLRKLVQSYLEEAMT